MRRTAALLVALLLVSTAAVPAAMAQSSDSGGSAYSGTHVAFETQSDAVVHYRVDNQTLLDSVAVQTESDVESQSTVGVDAGLSAVTEFTAAALSVGAKTETSATLTTESGAELRAHDNERGTLVVASGDESHYVTANLGGSAEANAESDSRVTVTVDGTQGTFIAVGNGTVTVNDEGNVSARLGADSHLVFRAYAGGKPEGADETERMIANETATAGVHVMQQGGATVADTVRYGSNTTVEVTQKSEGTVEMSVDRAREHGTVVVTSVSDAVLDASGGLSVTVDGEAAARASSAASLREAARGGSQSKYMVRGSASASARVFVALNHFSTRDVTMQQSGDDTTDGGADTTDGGNGGADTSGGNGGADTSDTTDDSSSSGGTPGFGVGVALAGLAAAAAMLARRR